MTPLEMAIVIVVAVVVGIIMFILGQNKERSMYAKTVGSAEEKSNFKEGRKLREEGGKLGTKGIRAFEKGRRTGESRRRD